MRKPITNPVESEYIHLIKGSRIHWDVWTVLDKKSVAFEVVCGNCGNTRWVRRNTLLAAHRMERLFSGLCRSCNSVPPPAYPGYKKGYMRTVTSEGYISLVVSGLSPEDRILCEGMSQKNNGSPRVLEHRLVMARRLGRPLLRGEIVHHKNGHRKDNRDENLELLIEHHVKGQRPHDLEKENEKLKAILDERGIQY